MFHAKAHLRRITIDIDIKKILGVHVLRRYGLLALMMLLSACATDPRPKITIPQVAPKPQVIPAPRVVLVLGGGGARGFAHLGVIQALVDHHIPIDLIVGTSIGGLVGVQYADAPAIQGLSKRMLATPEKAILSYNLGHWGSGLVSGYRMQNYLLKHLHARWFKDLKIPLVVVATDFISGRRVVIQSGPIAPAVNASAAIPGVFQPVFLYGHHLVDGGVSDPVAVDVAESFHPQLIIAVNIDSLPDPCIPAGLFKRMYRGFELLSNNFTQAMIVRRANVVVIHPRMVHVPTLGQVDRLGLIHQGYQAASVAMPRIRSQLRKIKQPLSTVKG